jgi:hypothetical protein
VSQYFFAPVTADQRNSVAAATPLAPGDGAISLGDGNKPGPEGGVGLLVAVRLGVRVGVGVGDGDPLGVRLGERLDVGVALGVAVVGEGGGGARSGTRPNTTVASEREYPKKRPSGENWTELTPTVSWS